MDSKRIAHIIKGITLCPLQSSILHRTRSQEVIEVLVASPLFSLDLDLLELLINTNFFPILYQLASKNVSYIRRLLQSQLRESEEVWEALGKSFESGLFLEIKIWFVKQFGALATT